MQSFNANLTPAAFPLCKTFHLTSFDHAWIFLLHKLLVWCLQSSSNVPLDEHTSQWLHLVDEHEHFKAFVS